MTPASWCRGAIGGPTGRERAARVLRLWAVTMGTMGLTAGCLLPPDDPVAPLVTNVPPRFDLDTLDPSAALFDADPDCRCFRLRAQLFDDDDDALQVRIASNVGRDNNRARCFSEERTGPAALGQSLEALIIPANEFLAGFPSENVHVISMFVTDAPAFATPLDEPATCAQLPSADGGTTHTVIEQRWTVRFIPGLGECAGCPSPSGG